MERQIAELAGKNELRTREIREETTELILRESPCPDSHRGEKEELPGGRGKGLGGAYSKEGAERFLAAVRKHVAVLETVRSLMLEEYERSCREQITVRKTVRKNFVKLEVVLKPGKPRKGDLAIVQRVEAELALLKKSLGWDRLGSG